MIIWSTVPREVGKAFLPTRIALAAGEQIEGQPIFVLREATRGEYAAQGPDQERIAKHLLFAFFYEVSTD